MSKLLVAAYILDVIAIIAFGLISYAFSKATPHYHPFSLLDLSISYPFKGDTVTDTDLLLASVLAPALIIVLVSLLCVPRPTTARQLATSNLWRRKLWEWFVGWMGLALSLATQFLVTQGLKNVVGKPRPDMLARCMPDLSNVSAYDVGGFGQPISERWVLVNQTICTQTDAAVLDDGFRSFPSGHAATSFSGLLYLTLYLSTKFSISFPLLPSSTFPLLPKTQSTASDKYGLPYLTQLRDEAASAPTWLLFLVYVPVGAALYISGSRYFDYHHHGFDIISGALIGILTSYFAYRWYHVPIGHSAGWSFGPRSSDRAFGVGVGAYGYVDSLVSTQKKDAPTDLESGSEESRRVAGGGALAQEGYERLNGERSGGRGA